MEKRKEMSTSTEKKHEQTMLLCYKEYYTYDNVEMIKIHTVISDHLFTDWQHFNTECDRPANLQLVSQLPL